MRFDGEIKRSYCGHSNTETIAIPPILLRFQEFE